MARVKKEKKEKREKKEKTGKKGGKKKILILLLGLVLIAAGAFAVVRFVLPRLGGGGNDVPAKSVETYTVGEDSVAALDTILEEGEGELIVNRGPGKNKTMEDNAASVDFGERYTYIYTLESYAVVVDRYLDLLLGEAGFSLVDETYLVLDDRPELVDAEGTLIAARASAEEGHVFQLVIGWSQATDNLAVRVAAPEGTIHQKAELPEPEPASVREQLDALETMRPEQLALEGSSIGEYDIYPIEGFVNIDGNYCRRFNFYKRNGSRELAGIIFYSGDQQHIYRMDVEDNSIITELR